MTEQSTAYRNDHEAVDENDPLAELARIVSGEPSRKKETAAPVKLEAVPAASSDDFDIENELLKELGDAPANKVAAETAPADASEFEISDEDFAAELQIEDAFDVDMAEVKAESAPQSDAGDDNVLSLEDQLMAELDGSSVDVSETDQLVDETVTNAMRDVEMASMELADDGTQSTDQFDDVEEKASRLAAEARLEVSDNTTSELQPSGIGNDSVEDFFAEGFEDLLQEEIATSSADPVPVADNARVGDHQDQGIDFVEAFAAELENGNPDAAIQQGPEFHARPEQEELALENDFAKAFASELSGNDPAFPSEISMSHDNQSVTNAAFVEPYDSIDDPIEPASARLDPHEMPVEGRSHNGFKLAVGALAVALVLGMGVVGWGYFSGQGDSGEPAIIKADSTPAKVKPTDPGGEEIANQNNEVYNQVAGNSASEPTQEELISSRQQPVDVQPKADTRLVPDAQTASTDSAPLGLSPKRVKTLTVKPDGTIVSSDTGSASAEPATINANSTSAETETASTAPEAENAASEADGGAASIDGATSTGVLAIPQPSPLPAAQALSKTSASTQALGQAQVSEAAPAEAVPAPESAPAPVAAPADSEAPTQIASLDNAPAPVPVATSSEWKIQVSSQRSREAAESSFNNLQRRFSSILGGRAAVIERADIEGKGTFYRAKVLAESKDEAGQLCTRLKNAGGSCFVTR